VKAAKAVDYVGAGTIEFIADASEGLRADRIWFMEMNTRLQVEHPVTEEITGQDLVEWQLRVASGEPLPRRQDELGIDGWAMEARLYAENPATGFLPSTGDLDHLFLPDDARIETGVEEGDTISPFYDPMIAKIVCHGETREEALEALRIACGEVECVPVRTNAWFLHRLLDEPDFRSGDVTTGFIADHIDTLASPPEASQAVLQIAARNILMGRSYLRGNAGDPGFEMATGLRGFRINGSSNRAVRLSVNGDTRSVALPNDDAAIVEAAWDRPGQLEDGRGFIAFEGGASFEIGLARVEGGPAGGAGDGAILSPMPGRIIAVDVAAGQTVVKGQKLVTLEAMKMEHSLTAPFDGVVAELNAEAGGQVSEGALLVRIDKTEQA
jgi:3-methylcrotonyl-CoA carboxylase alpha subunit